MKNWFTRLVRKIALISTRNGHCGGGGGGGGGGHCS
jgi:hypothetical protein